MVNSKDNKTDSLNYNDTTKKSSLPAIVGTSAILLASVVTCDINVGTQVGIALTGTAIINSQCSASVGSQDSDNHKKKYSINSNSPYLKNASCELFYDSDIEDDASYYGDWDVDDYDDEEDFILW